MFIQLAVVLILAGANPAEEASKPYYDLGEQLVGALRSGDLVGYAHCWLPVRRMEAIARASKRPIPTDQLEAMKAYFRKRNHQVARSFQILTDLLAKQGKIEELRLVDVTISGDVEEEHGLQTVTMFCVEIALGNVQYKITVDDGVKDGGAWYFTDSPLHVMGGPDNKVVSFAVKKE